MRKEPTSCYGRRFAIVLCLFAACLFLYAIFDPAHAKTKDGSGNLVVRYDKDLPLVIDPDLEWNTFLGEWNSSDYQYGITVDKRGNVYVTGSSTAPWGSSMPGDVIADAYAAKLRADGTLVWNTFFGETSGVGSDLGYGIAVDDDGNVYVVGRSSATWGSPIRPYTPGNPAASYGVFVVKLTNNGTILWNTFLGGSGSDRPAGIVLDRSGNVYVAGLSSATWGSPINSFDTADDIFVTKLTTDGTMLWNTFLGGSHSESTPAIAVDKSGNVYVAGTSPGTWPYPIDPDDTVNHGFAAKLTTDGTFLWNTFLGGTTDSTTSGVAADGSGHVYVTGTGVSGKAYAAKLSGADGAFLWNNDFGENGTDVPAGIALDPIGNVYVAGTNGYLAKLTTDGTFLWNTFLGGSGVDTVSGLVVDRGVSVYVSGYTTAAWGSPIRAYTGGFDGFVAKLDTGNTTLSVSKSGTGIGVVSGAGLTCSDDACSGGYDQGTTVTLTAVPDGDSVFTSFAGCDSVSDNTCTVTMTSDRTVTATFTAPFNSTCTYAVTVTERSFAYQGGSANITVKAAGGKDCPKPPVVSDVEWITAGMDSFKNNSGVVHMTVSRNDAVTERSGALTIWNNTLRVTQKAAPCSLTSIVPISASSDPAGGTFSFAVSAITGCTWTVETAGAGASWLGATTATGSGSGPVSYTVSSNTGSKPRSARITVSLDSAPTKKKTFTVKQAGCSSVFIDPARDTFTASGGTESFAVSAPTGCTWKLSSSADWLTASPASGGVSYTGAPNRTGKQRSAGITVSLDSSPKIKKVFTVTEKK